MAFGGWSAEALEFYEGLEADNSKSYWTSHKAVYEDSVERNQVTLRGEDRRPGAVGEPELGEDAGHVA